MGRLNSISVIDSTILEAGSEVRLKKDQIVTQQFAKVDEFYLLKSGRVSFSLMIDESTREITVGESDEQLIPIGWSGFNDPGRYATTVKVVSNSAAFYCWNHDELTGIFDASPDSATQFLKLVCAHTRPLLRSAIHLLHMHGPSIPKPSKPAGTAYHALPLSEDEEIMRFLTRSSFFEPFDEEPLEFICQNLEKRVYPSESLIYQQEDPPDGIYLLGLGKVRFSYSYHEELNVSFRQVVTPGFVLGWSGAVDMKYMINAHAVQETVVYFISADSLSRVLKLNPHFAPNFYKRLLWLISHQLQAIRARIIASKFNHEIIAIGNLIDQNSAKLSLNSPLHKIPHLLENKLTVVDALQIIDQLKEHGTSLEKNICIIIADILEEFEQENSFYHGLVDVYKSAVNAPKSLSAADVRVRNAVAYQRLFKKGNYLISGTEHLPDSTGHIFIYNHLRNHPYNTLPNQFQITLDSHFISAMILLKRYNDPGLRIVRIGNGKEYAHQEYYQRLGHIDVHTPESGDSPKNKKHIRQAFYNEASSYLKAGGNLIISPEGTSYMTEESPGPMKPGAFNLALSMKKEPLIIPIAVANFDKRLRNNIFSCIIFPPFKVSERIENPGNKAEMRQFLLQYQEEYRSHVEKAIALSKTQSIDEINEPGI